MYFQVFTKESTIVEISTCWEKRLNFSLDCFHNNQTNVCSLPMVFSRKNVISDPEPYLQTFYFWKYRGCFSIWQVRRWPVRDFPLNTRINSSNRNHNLEDGSADGKKHKQTSDLKEVLIIRLRNIWVCLGSCLDLWPVHLCTAQLSTEPRPSV